MLPRRDDSIITMVPEVPYNTFYQCHRQPDWWATYVTNDLISSSVIGSKSGILVSCCFRHLHTSSTRWGGAYVSDTGACAKDTRGQEYDAQRRCQVSQACARHVATMCQSPAEAKGHSTNMAIVFPWSLLVKGFAASVRYRGRLQYQFQQKPTKRSSIT